MEALETTDDSNIRWTKFNKPNLTPKIRSDHNYYLKHRKLIHDDEGKLTSGDLPVKNETKVLEPKDFDIVPTQPEKHVDIAPSVIESKEKDEELEELPKHKHEPIKKKHDDGMWIFAIFAFIMGMYWLYKAGYLDGIIGRIGKILGE